MAVLPSSETISTISDGLPRSYPGPTPGRQAPRRTNPPGTLGRADHIIGGPYRRRPSSGPKAGSCYTRVPGRVRVPTASLPEAAAQRPPVPDARPAALQDALHGPTKTGGMDAPAARVDPDSLDAESAEWLGKLVGSAESVNPPGPDSTPGCCGSPLARRPTGAELSSARCGIRARRLGPSGRRQTVMVAVVGPRLVSSGGESRFTIWAYKFVIFEVSSRIGRHVRRRQTVAVEAEYWDRSRPIRPPSRTRVGVARPDAALHQASR